MGEPEIHYTRIYRMFRYWQARGCIEAIFADSVITLHQRGHLDTSVLHGDGTTTVAKKGGDNIAFSGHKHRRCDKVIPFLRPQLQRTRTVRYGTGQPQ